MTQDSHLDWIKPYLAIGPRLDDPRSWGQLMPAKVTRIIDLNDSGIERKEALAFKMKYNGVKVPDPPEPEDLLAVFSRVHGWIEDEKREGGRVYLHCTAGRGRSPTCAMAHLMAIGETKEQARRIVEEAHKPTWRGEDSAALERALFLWEREISKHHVTLLLDEQSLGLRPFLEGKGHSILDVVAEILGHTDSSKGVSDDSVLDYLKNHSSYVLVTKDRGLGRRCERLGLQVIYVDETEAVANEVLARLRQS